MKIGYARVSTPDQNPALQLEALEKAGCEKIYQEKKSAFKERPELIRALEDLRTGDILYVWSLDRLGRSMKEIRTNVDLIMNKGAHLVDVTHNIDTSTPSGKLLIPIFSMLAEIDQVLRTERTVAGWEVAKREGRTGGRKPGLNDLAKKKAEQRKCICQKIPSIQQKRSLQFSISPRELCINICVLLGLNQNKTSNRLSLNGK